MDKKLKDMEGRWFLQYSGCLLWKKGKIDTISFNYHMEHLGEELVLKEQVEYRENGKMRMKRGYEIPLDDTGRVFGWKGIGLHRIFRTRTEVLYQDTDTLILWFDKTLRAPASIDVLTRQKHIDGKRSQEILRLVENHDTLRPYLPLLESVNIY